MKITAYKTPLIHEKENLFDVITKNIPYIPERSVLVIASKLVSTCEGRFVANKTGDKEEKFALVRQEADFYTDPQESKYEIMLTIKGNWMFVNAGIDESNADGRYNLWPSDPQKSVNEIWQFLRSHYGVKEVGVTMSDSRSFPLIWGVVGHALAHCGFEALKSYVDKPDLFGRLMKMEQVNIMQAVTIAAVLEMGEGNESTPIGLVEEIKDIIFQDHPPTEEELNALRITMEEDVYAPLLTAVKWQKGNSGKV